MNKGAMQVERMEQANEIGSAAVTCRSCGREYRKVDLSDEELGHILCDDGCPSDDCPATELIAQAPDLKQQRDDLLAALKDILAMDADTKGHRKSHPRQTEVTTNS